MKIQIISERRVGMLRPLPFSSGLKWVRSVYYVIKKVKIGRKVVSNVTFAEIETCGEVNPCYGSRHRKQQVSTTLSLEVNGEVRIYEVLKYSGNQLGDIRTINLEVKS